MIDLGALDVERGRDGRRIAALMPDHVAEHQIVSALNAHRVTVSAAQGRDSDSVWVLSPRPIQVGRIRIVPSRGAAEPGALRLLDTKAFGTGLHATTALCEQVTQTYRRLGMHRIAVKSRDGWVALVFRASW